MASYETRFGSLSSYDQGQVVIIDDDPRNYAFSNVFDVASHARAFEQIAVAKNLEYVLAVERVEHVSPWRTAVHDQFALVMDGEVVFEFVDVEQQPEGTPEGGSITLADEPTGPPMGTVVARQGHMVLLPAGSAYRYSADVAAVLLLQTVVGPEVRFRWPQICQTTVN